MKSSYRILYGLVREFQSNSETPSQVRIDLYDDNNGKAQTLTVSMEELPQESRCQDSPVSATARKISGKVKVIIKPLGARAGRGLIKKALERLRTADPAYATNIFTGRPYSVTDAADDAWGAMKAVSLMPSGFNPPHVPLWKRRK